MAPAEETVRPFIGRLEVFEALRRRLELAHNGQGGFTLVVGDVGVGKSILIQNLAREAHAKGLEVLVGRVPSLENPPPLHLIRQALGSESESASAPLWGGLRPPPLAFVPTRGTDSVLLGFAPRMGFGSEETESMEERLLEEMVDPGTSGEGGHSWIFAQLSDRLLSRTETKPTLLILEDLHTADMPSLEFLEYLAPQLETHPLWIVATALPRASLTELLKICLERITRATRSDEVTLRPLSAPELGEFVRRLDGTLELRPEELTRWHSQTGGNPLFVEQILRRRKERGRAQGGAETPIHELSEFLARQLAELSDEEQRVLTVAAVIGKEFSFPLLLRASGEEEERLAEITEQLIARGVLREQPDERFEFVRDDLRGQIYGNLTETRRRLLHRRAAEALEAVGLADVTTIYALARHFYLGRVDDKAATYNRLAGDFAARSFASEIARDHYVLALESIRRATPHDPEAELEVQLELAIQLDRVGELQAAERCLREILEHPKLMEVARPTQKALLKVSLARVVADQGRMADSAQMTAELLAEVGDDVGPTILVAIHRMRGEVLYYLGLYEESLQHHDKALELARAQHNEKEIALETQRRANVLGMIPGRFEEAVKSSRLAGEELERQGDHAEAAHARMFLGVLMSQHGRVEEGLKELDESMRLAEKAHARRHLGWALFNQADLLLELGQTEEARIRNGRSRQILEQVGDRFGMIQVRIIEGKILLAAGETTPAEVELLEAYRLSRELNTPADEVDVVLRLAEVAWAREDYRTVKTRIAELERRGLARLRPDLVGDLEKLKERFEASGAAHAA
jgi:tetratricopeptide (TPR) repeat protein